METVGTEPLTPADFPGSGPNSLASVLQRMMARVVDSVVIAIPMAFMWLPYVEVTDDRILAEPPFAVTALSFLLAATYEVVLIAVWGRTLGKLALGVRVARVIDGSAPGYTYSGIRFLVPGLVAMVPVPGAQLASLVVYAWAAWDSLHQGLHDKAAGTVVVRTR